MFLERQVAHVIGLETACDAANLVAGGGVAFAVGVPLVDERPRAPLETGGEVGGMKGYVDELLAERRVGGIEVFALIDGGGIGVVASERELPGVGQL